MLGHILNAGIRALAASIILGGVLMFAVGGPDSPKALPLAAAVLGGFFIFWVVFVFMFGRRVPRREAGSRSEADAPNFHRTSGRRREEDETSETAADGHGGGDSGGD